MELDRIKCFCYSHLHEIVLYSRCLRLPLVFHYSSEKISGEVLLIRWPQHEGTRSSFVSLTVLSHLDKLRTIELKDDGE
jgi:hypothetical protein